MLLAAEEPPEHQILPIQGDLALSVAVGDPRSLLGGVVYVGGAAGWTDGDGPSFFFGGGVELGYATSDDPYRISLGGQLRAGLVWARPPSPTSSTAIPDLLLYLRVTPFGGGVSSRATNPMGMVVSSSRTFFGVRAGIGLTTLWAARMFVDRFPLFDVDGVAGELLKVLSTLVIFPLALLNHGEVAFEYAMASPQVTAVLFRVGTGF